MLDPPRQGAHVNILKSIVKLEPKSIVYVSCNPATLARDSGILKNLGFDLKRVLPIDMFPHTYHIESVSLFEKTS